jgi:hypothetical protein
MALRQGRWKLTGDPAADDARVGELEFRTPPIPRWQDWSWPVDYDLYEVIREDSPADLSEQYDLTAYLFQCLRCRQYLTVTDQS